jgi:hypothetical protein
MRYEPMLIFALSVSVFGIALTAMLALNPPMVNEDFLWRKPLIGSLFSLICLLGIIAAFFPRQCSHASHLQKEISQSTSSEMPAVSHHPDCERFSAHSIHINGHRLCAACTGLVIGGIIALVGTFAYFSNQWVIDGYALSIIFVGVAGVVLGFFQLIFSGFVRSALNTVFVLGAFLILIGIDTLIESLSIDVFILVLIVFWIFTRIRLSQWDHRKICSRCELPCKIY